MDMEIVYKNILNFEFQVNHPEDHHPVDINYESVHENISPGAVINNNIISFLEKFECDTNRWRSEEFMVHIEHLVNAHWANQEFVYICDEIDNILLLYINDYAPEPEIARGNWFGHDNQSYLLNMIIDACNLRGWVYKIYGV